ncbi:MAG: hypothetical protein C6P37_08960 [Caldibacillus debilis]|uniref:Uncharacterized protein n=1 Tax=Caldibacillus debilis TaxID=301148 RepID=A0A3E0K470_9BACI|nr:hypothetical protein [Bacillaceae bacterium]OUM85720.1 MAG: hypothetical protein BAA03_01345 [Caldibacillus debilis]REJ28351.1 MAG: hypothetical protein C6P37_08960 [Caldibacillus debilis]
MKRKNLVPVVRFGRCRSGLLSRVVVSSLNLEKRQFLSREQLFSECPRIKIKGKIWKTGGYTYEGEN